MSSTSRSVASVVLFAASLLCAAADARAQLGGVHTLYGDLKVDESKTTGLKPLAFDILLYTEGGVLVTRQSVPGGGRYRFNNLRDGRYELVVEVEHMEVARIRQISVISPFKNDFRQDILLEWREDAARRPAPRAATVSVDDLYQRNAANQKLFTRAGEALDKQEYERGIALLRQVVEADPHDFQAWTELGTAYFVRNNMTEAEKSYARALEARPTFSLALVNLGRLRLAQKNYDGAIELLSKAVKIRPQSPGANYYLGEAYLQVKKGSVAVVHLNEALRLDPEGRAEAHLRLALFYHAAGLRDKAAAEYAQFLTKRPNHPDRKKLERYIAENKQP
ncbi:MAG TPA: tetratricopeptide repeat protein [Pyrinomonadaceae bacterium]|jgi:tetratricopeptide (TPR) repeat protein